MPGEWRAVRLGDHVGIRHGWPFKSECFSAERKGRPIVVSIGNYRYTGGFRFESTAVKEYTGEYPREYELRPGSVLLVMTCQTAGGEILGIPARIPDDGRTYLHNQRMGLVNVTSREVDTSFLYWLFLSREFNQHLVTTASGTKIVHTAPSRIRAFEFALPPVAEQRAIAHILGTLDDKIELNRRMNETLEAMARALFKSWFVDFDPVRAKAEGRDPGLPPHLADLFPDSFEDSVLGAIPRGWRVAALDEVATFLNGLALQKYPPTGQGGLAVIKIAELRQGHSKGCDWANSAVPVEYIIGDGDVLFSWSGSLLVRIWCDGRGALNQHLFKVTSRDFPKWFCFMWTRHHLPDFQAIAAGKATTMGHIQRHHLSAAKVLIPPIGLLNAMDAVFAPLIARCVTNSVGSRTLAALRDALLPKLISGELRVRNAVRMVDTALT
jgi:type I restriction enzyme S subunit